MEMRPETLLARETPVSVFLAECGSCISFADVFGYIDQKQLLETMLYAFHRYGATHHIIDSLMKVSKLEEDYVAQGEFLNELQRFAKQTLTHVHLVAHPRKKKGNMTSSTSRAALRFPTTRTISSSSRATRRSKLATITTRRSNSSNSAIQARHGTWQLKFDPARYTYASL